MYSYALGSSSKLKELAEGVAVVEPVYDEKTKTLFTSRSIPLDVSMKDYYSFVNTMVTLGIAFPNASGRSSKPKIRDTFNRDSQFEFKRYDTLNGVLDYDEMVEYTPEFIAFINFVKYCRFIKSLRERKLNIVDTVCTTEISYTNNTINLFNMMRGMTTGKLAIETPHGTIKLDTLKVDEAIVEPLRNHVDTAEEIFAATKSHIDTIRKTYAEKEKKLIEETNKQLQTIRATGLKESWGLIEELQRVGYKMSKKDEYIVLTWKGDQVCTKVSLNKRTITNNPEDTDYITIPLPEEISSMLHLREFQIYIDPDMRIAAAHGKGDHPHLHGHSFCIGDAAHQDISVAPSLIYSLSTCNANSFGGGAGCEEIRRYIQRLERAYRNGEDMHEYGLERALEATAEDSDFGSVFGKANVGLHGEENGGRGW